MASPIIITNLFVKKGKYGRQVCNRRNYDGLLLPSRSSDRYFLNPAVPRPAIRGSQSVIDQKQHTNWGSIQNVKARYVVSRPMAIVVSALEL